MSTKNPHDSFAKDYLEELLSPLGKVTVSREIKDEPNEIDILFIPSSSPSVLPAPIGLLVVLATQTAVIEAYRNQPTPKQVRNCLKKLYMYFSELNRKSGKDDTDDDENRLGKLWIVNQFWILDFRFWIEKRTDKYSSLYPASSLLLLSNLKSKIQNPKLIDS